MLDGVFFLYFLPLLSSRQCVVLSITEIGAELYLSQIPLDLVLGFVNIHVRTEIAVLLKVDPWIESSGVSHAVTVARNHVGDYFIVDSIAEPFGHGASTYGSPAVGSTSVSREHRSGVGVVA